MSGLAFADDPVLEQMRLTIRALGMLQGESTTPEARQELLQIFRDWKRGEKRRIGPMITAANRISSRSMPGCNEMT